MYMRRLGTVFMMMLLVWGGERIFVYAAALTSVRDLVSTSAPNTAATHAIQFTTTTAVPAGGKIIVTLESGFQVPAGLSYTDVDLAVNAGSGFVDRSLAATPSATEDGVGIVSGTRVITITLGSSGTIAVGNTIRILIGTNASSGAAGSVSVINPTSVGSHRVTFGTVTASDVALDSAQTIVMIIAPITVSGESINVAPGISGGLPSGVVAAGNSSIELSFETDELAECRYATTPNIDYSAMTQTFLSFDRLIFFATVSGHTNNTAYTYYVRCVDDFGLANAVDYPISFTLDPNPISNTSIPNPGAGGQGGVGQFQGGSSVLFLASLRLTGWTSPFSTVHMTRDGVPSGSVSSNAVGRFEISASGLERGVYTFFIYAVDGSGHRSAPYAVTLSLAQGSNNSVTDIVIPPTIELERTTVSLNEDVVVTGVAPPGSAVDVLVTKRTENPTPKIFSATSSEDVADAHGAWTLIIPTREFSRASYGIRARAILSPQSRSEYGRTVILGYGESISDDASGQSDVNGDGNVNLVDFSIMLSAWGTDNPSVDFNGDGSVNLADFSILLFNWTG